MLRESAKVAQEKEVIERRKHRKSRDAAARLFKPILDQITALNKSGKLGIRLSNGQIERQSDINIDTERSSATYSYLIDPKASHHVCIWVETKTSLVDFGRKIKWFPDTPRNLPQILVGYYHKPLDIYLRDYLQRYPLSSKEDPFVFAYGLDAETALRRFSTLIAVNGACIVDE